MTEKHTSPEFYVWQGSYEYVYENTPFGKYEIVRNGEMRIVYKNPDGTEDILRYTTDLFRKGIETDTQLWQASEDNVIEIIDNPWFEVWDMKLDNEDLGEVFFDLDEAEHLAKKLYESEKTNG
jgi:hypothetical protein